MGSGHHFPWSHAFLSSSYTNAVYWPARKVRPIWGVLGTNQASEICAAPWNQRLARQRHRVAQEKSAKVAATREEVCSLVHSWRDCSVGLLRLVSLCCFTWKSLYKAPLGGTRRLCFARVGFLFHFVLCKIFFYFILFFVRSFCAFHHGSVHPTRGIHGFWYVYIRHSASGRR